MSISLGKHFAFCLLAACYTAPGLRPELRIIDMQDVVFTSKMCYTTTQCAKSSHNVLRLG